MGGSKPLRQEYQQREGTNRLHPERRKEIVPTTDKRPEPPLLVQSDDLCLALWNETCDMLQSMRFLVAEDRQVLEAYVLNYRELLVCADEMRQHGATAESLTGSKSTGAAQNWSKFMSLHLKLLNELGLTPAARAKLAPPENRSKKENNAVGKLIKKLGNG